MTDELEKVLAVAKVAGDTFRLPVDVVTNYVRGTIGIALCIPDEGGGIAVVITATVGRRVRVTAHFIGKDFIRKWVVSYGKALSPAFWGKVKSVVDSLFL